MAAEPGWVLVADDDATSRLLLFNLLERAGHRATVVADGQEAWEMVRSEPFDVVLLDILMPEPDGYEVLRRIKEDWSLRHVPVIMVSLVSQMDSVVRCIDLGADDYLTKPIDATLLKARVNACLTRKRLHELEGRFVQEAGRILDAAGQLGRGRFDPSSLDDVAHRSDPMGQLARVFLRMASDVLGREQALRDEIAALRQQLEGKGE